MPTALTPYGRTPTSTGSPPGGRHRVYAQRRVLHVIIALAASAAIILLRPLSISDIVGTLAIAVLALIVLSLVERPDRAAVAEPARRLRLLPEHVDGARAGSADLRGGSVEFGSDPGDHPDPAVSQSKPGGDSLLIGWVGGMTLVVVIVAIGATAVLPVHRGRTFQTAIAIGEIIVGIGLPPVAVLTWRRAARAPANRPSRWLDTVERIGPVTALGFAIALNLRPKGLLLGTAAGLVVAGSSLSATDSAVVLAVYIGRGVIHRHRSDHPDAGLAHADAAAPDCGPGLAQSQHTHITIVVVVMVGFVILGAGLAHL